MLNFKRLAGYLATGVIPEMTALDESLAAADAAPVGRHADGSPCYTPGCSRGGIPWANIQKHNAKERAQMKLDFDGKQQKENTEQEKIAELAKRLSALPDEKLADYLHAHDEDESTIEFKACMAEVNRRNDIAQGKIIDNLGERA